MLWVKSYSITAIVTHFLIIAVGICFLFLTSNAHATTTKYLNGRIVFTSDRNGNTGTDIFTMHSDGSDIVSLTNDAAWDWGGSWSPDGTKIAFVSERAQANNYDIYVMNADGSNITRLTTHSAYDDYPTWSPDGTKIMFESERDGDYEIYTMNANGTNQQKITNGANSSWGATWSHSGDKIAFVSDREGSDYSIYTMNANGSSVTKVTNLAPIDVGYPKWSPDDAKIAFHSTVGGNKDIYTMNVDGSDITRLTTDPYEEELPEWSPDGKKILFYKIAPNTVREIFTINLDGSEETNLTDSGYTIFNDTYAGLAWLGLPYSAQSTTGNGTISTISSDKDYSTIDYQIESSETLVLDGTLQDVTVLAGATLKGSGGAASITVAPGGVLAPGHSPGCISSGNMVLDGTYQVELAGATACTEYDQTQVTGTVTLSGQLAVTLLNNFEPAMNAVFTIIENDSNDPVNGTFSDLLEGGSITIGNNVFKISYVGGDGNDVTLTAQKLPGLPKTGSPHSNFDSLALRLLGLTIIILSLFALHYYHYNTGSKYDKA